jgi:hypothetical protein
VGNIVVVSDVAEKFLEQTKVVTAGVVTVGLCFILKEMKAM